MNKKVQAVMASCVLAASVLLAGIVLYLAFVFPRTVEVWKDQERSLSALERFMVNLSAVSNVFGIPILGVLVLAAVASLAWLAVSVAGNKSNSATGVPGN